MSLRTLQLMQEYYNDLENEEVYQHKAPKKKSVKKSVKTKKKIGHKKSSK